MVSSPLFVVCPSGNVPENGVTLEHALSAQLYALTSTLFVLNVCATSTCAAAVKLKSRTASIPTIMDVLCFIVVLPP